MCIVNSLLVLYTSLYLFKDKQNLFPPPPPPPDSIKHLPKTEREALTSMLMSYYMSGFHTGMLPMLHKFKYYL